MKDRTVIWIAIALMAIAILLLTIGCKSAAPVVKYERVEVPQPYWSPPENVASLPDEPWYEVPHLTLAEAEARPMDALAKVGQDLSSCLEDSEHVRWLYRQLVLLIAETPTPSPP